MLEQGYVGSGLPRVTGIKAEVSAPSYKPPEHPKGYEEGGIWLARTVYQEPRAAKVYKQSVAERNFEKTTPERIRWLTGIEILVDSSVYGQVGIRIINPKYVSELENLTTPLKRSLFLNRPNPKYARTDPVALMEVRDGSWSSEYLSMRFVEWIQSLSVPEYLTLEHGRFFRIKPAMGTLRFEGEKKDKNKNHIEYSIHIYPRPFRGTRDFR